MKAKDIKLEDMPCHFYLQLIGDLQNGLIKTFHHLNHIDSGDLIQKVIMAELTDEIKLAQSLNLQASKQGLEAMGPDETVDTAVEHWLEEFNGFMEIAADMDDPERTEFLDKFGMTIGGCDDGA